MLGIGTYSLGIYMRKDKLQFQLKISAITYVQLFCVDLSIVSVHYPYLISVKLQHFPE